MSYPKHLFLFLCLTFWFQNTAATFQDRSESVVDIDGNRCQTVKIGDQIWFAENLRVTKTPAGEPIQSYYVNEDSATFEQCGRLYTWPVAMNGAAEEEAQGICPDGWHLPTDKEWTELFDHLGGEESAGSSLLPEGDTGFNALLGGGADFRGKYVDFGKYALFWSSTEVSEERAYHHHIDKDGACGRFAAMKGARIAIRCVKNPGK